ncbi:Rho-GTPase-activating protein 8 [Eremomyces bilateralis CBS 781.70]|uniref:Rho-GTPase-activating protein 8 n=1 Tax=Eremomyces bilateralis CBS 781.70 TaxID=1392243 RepID=A0A6G1GBU9_9PEZI|nr:Rho-GTPase-activating protein 8 [Eremomyces bilateralis CBS 781.70]KAF1815568.1 Rho-GTPase-activating protein 8 [Eremomyces bilateralis CBS 781.70]
MASGFSISFWSSDYAGGLGVLFGKLQQGVQENQQVLTIARMRADAEDLYGQQLGYIPAATDRITGGFQRDDGASVRKAYEGVRSEMQEASKNHRKISNNIRELVVSPFSRWCDEHAARVQGSQDDLQARIKLHDKQADAVRKFRSHYYNKCRLLEDLEEEDKLAFKDPDSAGTQSPKQKPVQLPTPTVKVSEPDDEEDEPQVEIGDEVYQLDQVKKILSHMLETIKLTETKVPILGTYHNVSTGTDIVEYIQKHMNASSVSYAERIGQDIVSNGYLRLVGNVGNAFANSSRMFYQWRPKAFQLTGIPEKKHPMSRSTTIMSNDGVDSPIGTVQEYLAGWNPLNNPYPNETPAEKLRREAREADERYKAAVRKLDTLRCNLEEAMMSHLKYMERCELDRLKAIKAVILDFSGAISNVIPSLQSTVDNMMLFQETVQPAGDLRYLLENYRTGQFIPRVQVYENYYNSVDGQTFGIDLEARAKADRKRVPIIVTTILTFLDTRYPDLEGDEARRGIWLVDVPLPATHHLRNHINNGGAIGNEVLEQYEIPIVASVLKLYLLELPDSLVSSHVYEIVKTIYSSDAASTATSRVAILQSTLGQLRLANIATLDALATHFARLIELTSADDDYITALCTALAPCVLRPKHESPLTLTEKFSFRLVRDLLEHKEPIFGELKRSAAAQKEREAKATVDQRPRAISTDESNRRAHMEERTRAIIANRSRASSPAPGPRAGGPSHRRERSSGGPETRFPVAPSTAAGGAGSPTVERKGNVRGSLEVPEGEGPVSSEKTNGSGEDKEISVAGEEKGGDVVKRDSLSRGVGRIARKAPGVRMSVGTEDRPVGVELVDRPMDD